MVRRGWNSETLYKMTIPEFNAVLRVAVQAAKEEVEAQERAARTK